MTKYRFEYTIEIHDSSEVFMNLQLMLRDARPTGGVWALADVLARVTRQQKRFELPIIIRAQAGDELCANGFAIVAGDLPFGSVVVFPDLDDEAAHVLRAHKDWMPWAPPGRESHESMFVRSIPSENNYATHRHYLRKAVMLTTGPVLELGCGEGSTPLLHDICGGNLGPETPFVAPRLLVSIDSDAKWLEKFVRFANVHHHLAHIRDPSTTSWLNKPWSVVFVDHSPGETRKVAVEAARERAEYIVIHDTEEHSYGLDAALSKFKYKMDFRYFRPWTTVASNMREIFESPIEEELTASRPSE